MKSLKFASAFVALVLTIPAAAQTFVFNLSGTQEVPPVSSQHSGGCHGLLDQGAATFSLTCVHDIPFATLMHIHRAPAGANGAVAFDMGDPSSPVVATWTGMTASDIADLLAGDLYLNIHTAGRPAGEIRGQIIQGVDAVSFSVSGSQVVPPSASPATASCTADLNAGATALAVNCTHTLASAVSAHVHDAPFASNGPIVFTFPTAASPLNASIPMTPLLVAKYAATFLYLDIHSDPGTEEDPGEEIRGQIGTPPAAATTGTIIIEKATYPAGGTGFSFSESITPGSFVLNDGGTQTFTLTAPGTYTVSENDPSGGGFTLGAITCEDADSTSNTATRTATINLAAGETVRCTFENVQTSPTDTIFVFHLSGDQEVPPITTPERGGCMGRFDSGASSFTLVCTHNVDLPTIMHIHRAPAGSNGGIAFDLGEPTSPVIATWTGMTPGDIADLMAGNLYVNIHTAGRPAGVIRGQIVPRTVDTVAFTADTSQNVPPGSTTATATCTADLNAAATGLQIDCTHTMASPDAAHVHVAPRGFNGPVVHTFASPASPINELVPMTPRAVADFAAEFLYLDIHTPEGGDESASQAIRGQIATPFVAPTTGTIRIRKATSPAGGSGFQFTHDITPGGAFTLSDGGVQTFTSVAAGTYSVTENIIAGWTLTDINCGGDDSSGNPGSRTATIRLAAGETVECTFTNLQTIAAPSHFVFHLSGDQEVPASGSTTRGGCYGQLDSTTRTLSLVCTHNVTTATVAHIHEGAAGATGPPVFDLGSPDSPIEATWVMTPQQMSQLLAGNYYLNIHAAGRPEGEIRGQMLPRTVDRFNFTANGAQEVPPSDSTAVGNCLADLADDASAVFVQCSHNVVGANTNHLHVAPPGIDGPAIYDFPLTNPFSANVPLSNRLVADLAAGFLYVNIHTPEAEQGEIRGQLIGPEAAAAEAIPTTGEWAALIMTLAFAAIAMLRLRS